MNQKYLKEILDAIEKGQYSADEAYEKIKYLPFDIEKLGYATLDHHRNLRLGLGEVVYGEFKSVDQIIGISERLSKSNEPILITRISDEKVAGLKNHFPSGKENFISHTFIINPVEFKENRTNEPYICILTAGTSDIPVAEEAVDVCGVMGAAFVKLYDIGVTGVHRIIENIDTLNDSSSLIVIAGMEGALPSVIGGLVNKPIFAVPTDIGYGASFKGLSALLAMLNSCAPGITVTNINGGFTAAFAACRVINMIKENKNSKK
ncbi:MAG: nickel pincer cofactor biosynthesis protein LarB [Ignavibacteriaceae bacterium]